MYESNEKRFSMNVMYVESYAKKKKKKSDEYLEKPRVHKSDEYIKSLAYMKVMHVEPYIQKRCNIPKKKKKQNKTKRQNHN